MPTLPLWLSTCFDEPLDGVPGVAALVDVGRAFLGGLVRAHIDEIPLRHPPPAHVLVDEDVTRLARQRRRAQVALVLIGPVRLHAVRRPRQEDRIPLRLVLRRVDGGEEPLAVAHGDAVLIFRVACLDLLQALCHGIAGREQSGPKHRQDNRRHQKAGKRLGYEASHRVVPCKVPIMDFHCIQGYSSRGALSRTAILRGVF